MPRASARLTARLGSLLTKPLFLAQVAGSLAGALAMILGANAMNPSDFVVFSLANLISATAVGVVRAGLFQPALIQLRIDSDARTSAGQAVIAAAAAALATAVVTHLIHPLSPAQFGLLAGSGALPILHDWVRFRAMSFDRRWAVLALDGVRLLLVSVASALVLGVTTDPIVFQAVQGAVLVVPVLAIAPRLPRVTRVTPLARYGRAALLQLADFSVGQFNTTIPLIVLGGLGGTGAIAGVRFAQTLLGPLNLLFSASTANLITDAAVDPSLADDRELIRRGSQLARRVGLLSVVVVLVLAAAALATGFELRGVPGPALLQGLGLVGAATATSGWAGMHAILLRLLGRQGTATAGRAGLVFASGLGYVAGYYAGGVNHSITMGFIAAAICSPLALVLPAHFAYQRIEAAEKHRQPVPDDRLDF